MELKRKFRVGVSCLCLLLIVLNGIETMERNNDEHRRSRLLIVLNGIETAFSAFDLYVAELLIVLNGIETKDTQILQEWFKAFNRTKWN